MREGKYDEVVLKCIDDVMKEIFGERAALIIYDYLEQCSSLKREDIPEKLDVLMQDLEKLLGSGAVVVKKAVVKKIMLNS